MEKLNKRIAVLTCLEATKVCSGAACFRAFNQRKSAFERYKGEGAELIAFFHCNGCHCDYAHDSEYLEKIQYICSCKPDAVHVGKCTQIKGVECKIITQIIKTIEAEGILVIRGTH